MIRRLSRAAMVSGLLLAVVVAGRADAASYAATIIDRKGDRHDVDHLTYQKQPELEIYIGDRRQLVRFRQIERLVLGGNPGDGEFPATVEMRDGEILQARMYGAAAGGTSPHRAIVSGPRSGGGFLGRTDLGPFAIQLTSVRELRFHHEDEAAPTQKLKATLVDAEGRRFEIDDLRFRGRTSFTYDQGRNRRHKPLSMISRIEFPKAPQATETLPVAITFHSGKVVHGTVEVSTIRVPGETDRLYEQRVFGAITGHVDGASFSAGLHQVRLLMISPTTTGEAADHDMPSAP